MDDKERTRRIAGLTEEIEVLKRHKAMYDTRVDQLMQGYLSNPHEGASDVDKRCAQAHTNMVFESIYKSIQTKEQITEARKELQALLETPIEGERCPTLEYDR